MKNAREGSKYFFNMKKAVPVAVLFSVAALISLPGAVSALIPYSGFEAFTAGAIRSQVTDPEAIKTWYLLHQLTRIMTFVWSALLAFGMWKTVRSYKGLDLFGKMAYVFHKGVHILMIVLAVIYVVRIVLYLPKCMDLNWGAYLLMALILMEGIMGAFTYFLLRFIKKGFYEVSDAADTIFYTHMTSIPEPSGISGLSYWLFWILGGFDIGLCGYLLFYGFSGIIENVPLLVCGAATILTGCLIFGCKKKMENIIRAEKNI